MPHAPADRFTRVALLLTGLMMCLPFVQMRHTEPLGFFYSEWVAFVLGLAAMTLMLSQRARDDLRIPWIALLPAGLLAVLIIQVVLAKVEYVEQAVVASLYLIWAAALMVLGALLRRRLGLEAMVQTLAWCVVAGGMFNAFAGILQTYDIRGLFEPVILFKVGDRAYGNLGQANHFGNYIALAIASLAYLIVREKAPRGVAGVLLAILIFSLALSASISVWLYLMLPMMLAGVMYLRQRSPGPRRLVLLCVIIVAGFGVAQLLTRIPGLEPSPIFASATERLFYQPTSIWIRFKLWHEAWQMFVNSPLLGVGYGQFVWQHFMMVGTQAGEPLTGLSHNAHNLIFQLLAETGIAGTGILAAAIALWILGQRTATLNAAQWWLLVMMGVIALHSLLEYPLWSAYFLGIAAVLLGAGETRFIALREGNYLRTGAFLVIAVGAFSAVNLLDRYYTFETSLYSPPNATPEELRRNDRALLGLRGSVFTPYVDIAIVIAMPLSGGNVPAKLAFVSRVARFASTGPVVYKYSALLALHGDIRQAVEILNRALLAYPEYLDYIMPQLEQIRAADKPKIAPYLARVQQHLRQRKTPAPESGVQRAN